MSDDEDDNINNINIDDEVLIAIVQANPCLYAKNDPFYKDNKVKEMKWETIAKTLNCTSNEVKKRWDSLRNQYSRKLRQHKTVPSGSGSTTEWPLMSCMSFLKSYIQNRKTRGSLLQTTTSKCNATSSSCSINSVVQTTASRCNETSSSCSINATPQSHYSLIVPQSVETIPQSHAIITTQCVNSARLPDWNDCTTSLSTEILDTSVEDPTMDTTPSESSASVLTEKENIEPSPQTSKKSAKRILVPPLDNFAKKKKAKNECLEDLLSKSSQAISDLATLYKHKEVEKKEESPDSHAIVISQALKSVTPENQLSCLIAVLQLIEQFKE